LITNFLESLLVQVKFSDRSILNMAKKSTIDARIFIQDCSDSFELSKNIEEIKKRSLEDFAGLQPDVTAESIRIYIKPNANKAYYVVNDEFKGSIDLVA
jgi:hypothetical protein